LIGKTNVLADQLQRAEEDGIALRVGAVFGRLARRLLVPETLRARLEGQREEE
jgi:hypothetical protein